VYIDILDFIRDGYVTLTSTDLNVRSISIKFKRGRI